MKFLRIFVALFWAIIFVSPVFVFTGTAYAQQGGGVVVFPPITPGDCASWKALNILQDAGAACGGSGTTPGIPASSLGFVGDGVCASDFSSCSGTDNTQFMNAAITTLCNLPVASTQVVANHIYVRRAKIIFDSRNYFFASSPNAWTCAGIGFQGQGNGGTAFSTSTAGVNFLQFGTFSNLEAANSTYYQGTGGSWSVEEIQFVNSANNVQNTRTGNAIMDNGSGLGYARNIRCFQISYCADMSYGGQLDTWDHVVVEQGDHGIYIGPGSNQVTVHDFHAGPVVWCVEEEGSSQIAFTGVTDLNSCAQSSVGATTGAAMRFSTNTNLTAQGVSINPGNVCNPTCGSATGGGYQFGKTITVANLWLETRGADFGFEPLHMILFDGSNTTDAMRGIYIQAGIGFFSGTVVANSDIVGSTAAISPAEIHFNSFLYNGTDRANLASNIAGFDSSGFRVASGGSLLNWCAGTCANISPARPQTWTALVDGATVATDAGYNNNFTWTTAQVNPTLSVPTNLAKGEVYNWAITQDATGGRIITFASIFHFPIGAAVSRIDPAANASTLITCYYDGSFLQCSQPSRSLAATANQGNTNATSYLVEKYPLGGNNTASNIGGQTTTGVTTAATAIYTPVDVGGNLVIVTGSDGTNKFNDLVMCNKTTGATQIFGGASGNYAGAPATRTYGGTTTCQLTMSTGTYSIRAFTMEGGER